MVLIKSEIHNFLESGAHLETLLQKEEGDIDSQLHPSLSMESS